MRIRYFFLCFLMLSCVTPSPNKTKDADRPLEPGASGPGTDTKTKPLPIEDQAKIEKEKFDERVSEDLKLFESLLGAERIQESEMNRVLDIAALSSRNHLDNAIVYMGITQLAIAKKAIQEASSEGEKAYSLEAASGTLDFPYSESLAKNILLHQARVYQLTATALGVAGNSAEFDRDVRNQITERMREIQPLVHEYLGVPASSSAADALAAGAESGQAVGDLEQTPTGGDADAGTAGSQEGAAATDAGIDTDPSNLLAQAANLAEDGSYKEAVVLLTKAPPSDPQYRTVREKIVAYSNLAVKALRTSSATEFQNSQQVAGEKSAKLNYLKKSKLYLETALKDFPEATSLSTVRSNLAFVNQEIAKVESSQAAE